MAKKTTRKRPKTSTPRARAAARGKPAAKAGGRASAGGRKKAAAGARKAAAPKTAARRKASAARKKVPAARRGAATARRKVAPPAERTPRRAPAARPAADRTPAVPERWMPSGKPLAAKLRVMPGATVTVVGAPDAWTQGMSGDLPEGARVVGELAEGADFVVAFAKDMGELVARLADIVPRLGPAPTLWIAYPKLEGGLAGELSRERVSAEAEKHALVPIAQIAVDETWSAMRFKRP